MDSNYYLGYHMKEAIQQNDRWYFRALFLSVFAASAGYLVFSLIAGWSDVVSALRLIGVQGTLIALYMSLINYGLRFVRWQIYLKHLGYSLDSLVSFRIYLCGFALTTTPGKAGEVYRSVLLKQFDVPYPVTFAAFVSERLSDLIAIVLLTLIGLAQYSEARGIVLAGMAAILLVFVCLASETVLNRIAALIGEQTGKLTKVLMHVVPTLLQARQCHTPGLLLGATMLSVLAWGAEAIAFYWVLGWLSADISLSYAVFVYSLSVMAGALSFLPGGLGSTEAVMVSMLALKGVLMPTAIAATVFIRLATLWFAVLIGFIALSRSRRRAVS